MGAYLGQYNILYVNEEALQVVNKFMFCPIEELILVHFCRAGSRI